jgi:hypothetical protein
MALATKYRCGGTVVAALPAVVVATPGWVRAVARWQRTGFAMPRRMRGHVG